MVSRIEKVLWSFANGPRLFQGLVKNSVSNGHCKLFSPLHLKVAIAPRNFLARNKSFYYMEESVLLRTKPLVDSIRHFIRAPSGRCQDI